jgi:Uma2 family endonuclease
LEGAAPICHDRSVAVRYDDEMVSVPRAVRFPVELEPPAGFDPERIDTWPRVEGRLEVVEGRLLFMPPCGDLQQDTAADVVYVLKSWARERDDFVIAGNEAGIHLGGDSRGADAAVFRRDAAAKYTGGFRRVAPVLAVEVAGEGEDEAALGEKARWYLDHGADAVWLLFPTTREAVVIDMGGATRHRADDRLREIASLPGLAPKACELFEQITRP